MAKFALLALAFAALVAFSAVSAHRATITTTTLEEDDNPRRGGSGERCHEQMMQQQMLSHCWMALRGYQGRRLYAENPQQEHMQLCCQQLENMDEECRCEGLQMMFRYQQGQIEQGQMREMMMRARNLPQRCGIEPQECRMQMRSAWF